MSTVTQLSGYQKKQKQLEVTAEMLEQIRKVADTEVTADDIVVFEATAVNTRPLSKAGSIFDNGTLTRGTLAEMASRLNDAVESVPLHTLHMQGDEIPVGKVFYGYVQDLEDGNAELRAQFYLTKSEADLIEKINLGILDEVSVGLKSKKMLCSECGWDYFGEEAEFYNLWDRTCANDHAIGEDGVHVILSGVDAWMELSLVSRGAARSAKIHGRAKQVMSQEQHERIAASGFNPDAVTLFASPQTKPEERKMTKKPEVPETPAAPAEFDAKAAHEELVAKFDALLEVLKPVEADADADDSADEDNSELEALKAELGELKEKIATLGKPKAEDLTQDLPAGGVASDAITDAEKPTFGRNLGAFKTRK